MIRNTTFTVVQRSLTLKFEILCGKFEMSDMSPLTDENNDDGDVAESIVSDAKLSDRENELIRDPALIITDQIRESFEELARHYNGDIQIRSTLRACFVEAAVSM